MKELGKRIMSFLMMYEDDCRSCLNRYNCSGCRASIAKGILTEWRIKRGTPPRIDNSLPCRIQRIKDQLNASKTPLLSREIDLPNCSKELKEWTIGDLVRRGIIHRRRRGDSVFFEYFLPHKRKG